MSKPPKLLWMKKSYEYRNIRFTIEFHRSGQYSTEIRFPFTATCVGHKSASNAMSYCVEEIDKRLK